MTSFQLFVHLLVLSAIVHSLEVPETQGQTINCQRSKVDYNVTLTDGRRAGNFVKANETIRTMKRCLQHCCQMKGCDVAFLDNNSCYSVTCRTLDSCAPTMNKDENVSVAISYVARPKVSFVLDKHIDSNNAELEVTDNFIAEAVAQEESPFLTNDEDKSEGNTNQVNREPWKETRDATIAIGCGFVAVVMGVSGVIVMTRQLVEDEETYPYKPIAEENTSSPIEQQSTTKHYSLIDNTEHCSLNDNTEELQTA